VTAADIQKQAFINTARAHARALWAAHRGLLQLQAEWNALDYGNDLEAGDFTGDNEGLTGANIGSVVFDTADAIAVVMATGHATNVATIK